MLSPLDLQGKRITAKRKKYDKADMDEYLDFVFENYKALYDEHLETQKRLKEADEKIAYYRSIESKMCIRDSPNTGLPLPFLSNGLTSLLSYMIMIGILLNIGIQPTRGSGDSFEIH